jgi:inhibitor of cysteine peptidase
MAALLGLALWVSQAAAPPTMQARDERPDKRLRVNEKVTIALPENPSTGYQWQEEHDKDYLDFLGKEYRTGLSPDERLVGAGGTAYFTFRALKPGLTRVVLKYQRSWEPRPIKVETYDVLIH